MSDETRIPDGEEERQVLIAEYVLGLCRGAQAEAVRAWLEWDPDAARQARYWEEHWVAAVELLKPDRPPRRVWRRVAARTGAPSRSRWRQGWRKGWNSAPLWRGVSAALVVVVAVLLGPGRLLNPAPVYTVVLQEPGEAAQPGWRVTVNARGDLHLMPLVEKQYQRDRAVQFWTLAESDAGPRSLGLVKPDRGLVIPAEQLGEVENGQLFELTSEPPGGSPESRPTGPVLFIGRAVAL